MKNGTKVASEILRLLKLVKNPRKSKAQLEGAKLCLMLQRCVNRKGEFPFTVTVHLSPAELVALVRKAHAKRKTVETLIADYVADGNGGGGIMDTLRAFEN
jgi:hypothetical protein